MFRFLLSALQPLAAVIPGGWLLLAGRRRRGVLYAVPAALFLAVGATLAFGGREGWLHLLDPGVLGAAIAAFGLLAAVHFTSVADSLRLVAQRSQWPAAAVAIVAVGLAYGFSAGLGFQLCDTLQTVFAPSVALTSAGGPQVAAGDPRPEVRHAATPPPRVEVAEAAKRITVLLIGVDSLSTRGCCGLTDTLMVASFEPDANRLTMISLPRDVADFELYSGGTYTGKINSLLAFAAANPGALPDPPLEALREEISFLLGGLTIDHYAAVDLDGLLSVVDVLGGVEVNLDEAVNNPNYPEGGFYLAPGTHRLAGADLLAFVRSRTGINESDFTRAARQQQVVAALIEQATDPAVLARLPSLLGIVRSAVRTDLPLADLRELLDLVSAQQRPKTVSLTLEAPYTVHPPASQTGGAWVLHLDRGLVADLVADHFRPPRLSALPTP